MVDTPTDRSSSENSASSPLQTESSEHHHHTMTLEHTEAVHLPATPAKTFQEMGVRSEIVVSLQEMGFTTPFPVQTETYSPILARQDLIVQARTGSGKTAAFGIPLLHSLIDFSTSVAGGQVQCLALVPTRELALQVTLELEKIGSHLPVKIVSLYGGAPMGTQLESLSNGAHIAVGTPGRVLDHVRRGTLSLSTLSVLILDEADEMFSRGFYEDISDIIKHCQTKRQTLLFSATMPYDVERLCQKVMQQPVKIQLSTGSVSSPNIQHAYYMVSGMARSRDLIKILDLESPESAIVFCNTREETREVTDFLRMHGFDAKSISGSLSQKERERVMSLMRSNRLQFLVATDIAARGIDISHVTHVINFTFPESSEVYIHRTGRTGRAGRTGVAISLIGPRELGSFYTFKLTYKIQPTEKTLPKPEELQALREKQYILRLEREVIRKPAPSFHHMVQSMVATQEGERILAALLERYVTTPLSSDEVELAKEETSSIEVATTTLPEKTRQGSHNRPMEEKTRDIKKPRERGTSTPKDDGESYEHPRRKPRPNSADRGRDKNRSLDLDPKQPRSGARRNPRSESITPNTVQQDNKQGASASSAELYQKTLEPIHVTEGREYWEAWVDSRSASPSASPETNQPGPLESTSPLDDSHSVESKQSALPADTKPARRPRPRKRPARVERAEPVTTQEQTPNLEPTNEQALEPTNEQVTRAPRVYLNVGKRHGLNKERLSQLLSEKNVGPYPAQIRLTHTYLLPPEEKIDELVLALHGQTFDDRTMLCERARK